MPLFQYMKNMFSALIIVFYLFVVHHAEAADKMTQISVDRVKVGGEIGRRIDVTVNNNLLVVDMDNDFLKPFQEKISTGGYIGLGKTIDAAVRFAFYTEDERVIELKKHMVEETIKAQEADGYIGMMAPESRLWRHWDIHEMVYIVYGLVSDYNFFGEKKSLKAAKKIADYIINRWQQKSPDYPGGIHMVMANTGIDRAFMALSAALGDDRYENFLINQLGLADWDMDIVLGRHGTFKGHAYAFMARTLAQAELYRTLKEDQLLSQAKHVICFLTKQDGLLINGAVSYQECWHDNQIGFFKLGETCATAYLVRLLDNMLRLDGQSLYGDIMERVILNALFAAQSPDGRRLRYYVPFEGEKIYFDKDTYCCPCNFRRIVAELPGMIYYETDGGVAINLYTESSVKVVLPLGVKLDLKQETDYPNSGHVTFSLDLSQSATFPLKFRIPRWCSSAARIVINDNLVLEEINAGSFFTINREWKTGDVVKLEMPMQWRLVKGRKAQAGRAAVMRGPVLYTLNPELNKHIKPQDIKLLRLDPGSMPALIDSSYVRPEGLACRVKAWDPNSYSDTPNMELVLTEFPDPDGKASYFLLPNPSEKSVVEDELVIKK